jgi:hypothetical protein
MLAKLASTFRHLARKRERDADLDDEVRGFAEMLAEEKIRGGMKPDSRWSQSSRWPWASASTPPCSPS